MNEHAALKYLLRFNEGTIPHLYLDSRGFVTAGVGHKFSSRDELLCVEGWICRTSRRPASFAQIAAEWDNVNRGKPGLLAERYAEWTLLDLPADVIEALLDWDVADKSGQMQQAFPGFAGYPAPAQDALLDMAFNLGVNGLMMKFPHLRTAALASDWLACAQQCRRSSPVSNERNASTRALFEQAQTVLA